MSTRELTYEIEEHPGGSLVAKVILTHVGPTDVGSAHSAGDQWRLMLWNDEKGCSAELFASTRQDALAALDFHAAMVARLLTRTAVAA
ncbi:hypothetical protein [Mycolicibacterium fortuitum]|uniref:hypothetical protein n=1 Tax=Mycolicibacterium fortuitum TaxID=1766 RepID=UPI001AEFA75F|nr:hypothetical protein [Mycolicibacterium fortuitum]MBP3086987.1 hypothetical protein [Mycolicibacterium fortuitum]